MGDISLTVVRDYDGESCCVYLGASIIVCGEYEVKAQDLLRALKNEGLLDGFRVVEEFTYGSAAEFFD